MKVFELIEKLKEFDGELDVESISYAYAGCGCCGDMIEYEYDAVSDPYIAHRFLPRKKLKSGAYSRKREYEEVVRLDGI